MSAAAWSLVLCGAALSAAAAEPSLLSLVPQDAVTIAGLDAAAARDSSLGRALLGSTEQADGSPLEALAQAAGFDLRRDLQEAVVALRSSADSDTPLILLRGRFDAARIQSLAAGRAGSGLRRYRDVTLVTGVSASGGVRALAAPSPSLFVAGRLEDVQDAIDRWSGQASPPSNIARQADELRSGSQLWLLSRQPVSALASRAEDRNVSGVLQGDLFAAIEEWRLQVRLGSPIRAEAQAATQNPKDAAALADVAQFLVTLTRTQKARGAAGELLRAIQDFEVSAEDSRAFLRFSVPEDKAALLLRALPLFGAPEASGAPPEAP